MDQTYDLVGCGFGPSNLAIAIAIVERWNSESRERCPIKKVCFIEKHPRFLWHPGMLLPGTTMQISFLKDLVTLRNPSSEFTFLAYLHSNNRLLSFINRGSFFPTRREFADYLAWAAEKVKTLGIEISYGEEVVEIRETCIEGVLQITSSRDGSQITRTTKNLLISPGGSPAIPSAVTHMMDSENILHTSIYAYSIPRLLSQTAAKQRPIRIAVLGGGQSSAEVTIDLYRRLEHLPASDRPHEVDLIIRKGSLKPSDDSPFTNTIFNPEATDLFYEISTANPGARSRLFSEYRNTNYGVVNPETLDTLHELLYEQELSDGIASRSNSGTAENSAPRLRILNNQCLIGASLTEETDQTEGRLSLTLQDTHKRTLAAFGPYDILILGTGYERQIHTKLLSSSELGKKFYRDQTITETDLLNPLTASSTPDSTEASTPTSSSLSLEPGMTSPSPKLLVTRKYRLVPIEPCKSRIYVQGCVESTHGISDTLLSVIGVRAGELVDDLWKDEPDT
ncbi:hypothetical protein SISSUDRAFT_1115864 [Sistotremastrum suecicum HHB10207 ss-3]|uniref:L-ornithine N(5)-monooxygenase [NAD(P)H] n=1 Tax=Sistotremastrum suecicum HHB10207 ss-3 TaxID=1314776 RepID=A0A166IS89_9AGAM|nr:hypothetical protein SISSUDRAFT_1115864 [Sistotremastrum suecicum HHB10207 ss-3]